METQELTLHQQKVTILSRLVKDNQLTLEEALLILKEEEKEPAEITVAPYNPNGIGTIQWNPMPYTSTGTLLVNTNGNVGIGTTTSSSNTKLSINSPDADLNN
jgi:hypothetical protein